MRIMRRPNASTRHRFEAGGFLRHLLRAFTCQFLIAGVSSLFGYHGFVFPAGRPRPRVTGSITAEHFIVVLLRCDLGLDVAIPRPTRGNRDFLPLRTESRAACKISTTITLFSSEFNPDGLNLPRAMPVR